ncbi:MAG: hypothetical protein OEU92_16590 [Alphaproteobacteria bacterium]|nr:hypothetical protein [Alphaproteobacteria bacterium]
MSDLDKIFEELDYAETIEHSFPKLGLTVEIAETHPIRNRPFVVKLAEVMKREGVDDTTSISRAGHINETLNER